MQEYETGTKQNVMVRMAFIAIETMETLVTKKIADADDAIVIDRYKAVLRDFKKLLDQLL